jgi:hypothetical protein
MFNENTQEYSKKQNGNIPVWQSPKYKESKKKAIEILESKKYGLAESDFWILMNETKTKKMGYTGLIVSHNGCLKINDKLEEKLQFKPSCVTRIESGYGNSLVFQYANDEQGLFEVGEVSSSNLKNAYPYAMAFKRLFDRVVLKNCKLAYAGIYSDSEADEFADPHNETVTKPTKAQLIKELENYKADLKQTAQYFNKALIQDLTVEELQNAIDIKTGKVKVNANSYGGK